MKCPGSPTITDYRTTNGTLETRHKNIHSSNNTKTVIKACLPLFLGEIAKLEEVQRAIFCLSQNQDQKQNKTKQKSTHNRDNNTMNERKNAFVYTLEPKILYYSIPVLKIRQTVCGKAILMCQIPILVGVTKRG